MDNSPVAADRRRRDSALATVGTGLRPVTSSRPNILGTVTDNSTKQKRRRNVPRSRKAAGASSGTVYALAIGESIDIGAIEQRWEQRETSGEKNPLWTIENISTVLSIEKQVSYMKVFDKDLDCFVFAFGCVVCWDATEEQIEVFRERLAEFIIKPVVDVKRDKVVYTSASDRIEQGMRDLVGPVGGGGNTSGDEGGPSAGMALQLDQLSELPRLKPKIIYGNIQLTSTNAFEKLAYSYAIAQSVRLDVFEDDISNAIAATSEIPIHLAKRGSVGMSNKAVTIKMGELFLQRSNVNLHSDILDTPELFWEFDEYEQMYILGREYLDIDKRIEILNQRLDIMKDLFEMLQNELNIKHSAKIEIIIIVLILAEVVLQILGLVISWITSTPPSY
jgi:uncharacterized Rmd1/YagE family protein